MTRMVWDWSSCKALAAALLLATTGGLASLALAPAAASAQEAGTANINISPRRVIFTPNERTAAVYVFNQGAAPVLVDVSLIDNVMLPDGEIVAVETGARRDTPEFAAAAQRLRSAKELVLATPSRLSIPAGEGRTVRLRASMPDDGTAREWRTHLTVATVPSRTTGLTAERAAELEPGELSFLVETTFGISIPLIVRNGAPEAAARFGAFSLAEPSAADQANGVATVLNVPVGRTGEKSLYGNLEVRAGPGRNAELLGIARGIGVYAEQDERLVRIPLTRKPAAGEALTVRFSDEESGAEKLLLTDTYIAP
jgi:P pilus assembly chaperone PapD